MNENIFYDGTKLLSQMDLDGKKPQLYLSTANRSAGKTTWFNRYLVKQFKKKKEKFMLIYRFDYELSDVADKFFKDIKKLFFPDDTLESKSRAKGKYMELFLNNQPCGYAVALNSADKYKNFSHLFSDTKRILFDEFQSETNHYCTHEVRLFQSLLTTVCRGSGEQVRYVPVYMIANLVTLLNPYYVELEIADKLSMKTNYYRGHGFVLEQSFYGNVAEKQKDSGLFRAFANSKYSKFVNEKIYLNDDATFIAAPSGQNRYLVTLVSGGQRFAVREYSEAGVLYCSTSIDESFKKVLAVRNLDMDINLISIKQFSFLITIFRKYFEMGLFRFQNQQCKSVIFDLLAIK